MVDSYEGVPLEDVPWEYLEAEVWRRYGLAPLSFRDVLSLQRAKAGEEIKRGALVKMGPDGRVYNAIPPGDCRVTGATG